MLTDEESYKTTFIAAAKTLGWFMVMSSVGYAVFSNTGDHYVMRGVLSLIFSMVMLAVGAGIGFAGWLSTRILGVIGIPESFFDAPDWANNDPAILNAIVTFAAGIVYGAFCGIDAANYIKDTVF